MKMGESVPPLGRIARKPSMAFTRVGTCSAVAMTEHLMEKQVRKYFVVMLDRS